jgi:hypothetical protein
MRVIEAQLVIPPNCVGELRFENGVVEYAAPHAINWMVGLTEDQVKAHVARWDSWKYTVVREIIVEEQVSRIAQEEVPEIVQELKPKAAVSQAEFICPVCGGGKPAHRVKCLRCSPEEITQMQAEVDPEVLRKMSQVRWAFRLIFLAIVVAISFVILTR